MSLHGFEPWTSALSERHSSQTELQAHRKNRIKLFIKVVKSNTNFKNQFFLNKLWQKDYITI